MSRLCRDVPKFQGPVFCETLTDAFWDAANRILRPYHALGNAIYGCIYYDEFEGYFKVARPVLVPHRGATDPGRGEIH